jgi:hypothetical protein
MTNLRIWTCALALLATACADSNRAGLRIPGASTDLPETFSGYHPAHYIDEPLVLAPAADVRRAHYGERIAGTRWRARMTDSFGERGAQVLEDRLAAELTHAGLFAKIVRGQPPDAEALVLRTEVRAFCAQAYGFLFVRVGGMTAIDLSLTRGDRVLWSNRIEHVVTDADPEYTGWAVGTIEQAMRRTMADSVRLTAGDMLQALDRLSPLG